MSNNIQSVELTDITAPLLAATQGTVTHISFSAGLTTEDLECIISLFDCAKSGETRRKQSQPSICEVPRIFRELNESSFIPQLVSIGPIHRENKNLQEFEWLKGHYLDDLLSRCDSTAMKTLEACVLEVKTLIPQIRESYGGMIKNYSDNELARMMVMDGCFILEFCLKHEEEDLYLPNKMQNLRIAMDLMLLENQVPFSVLQALFNCSMGEVSFTLSQVLDAYLAPYIQQFRSDLLPEKNSILSNVFDKYLAPYIELFRSLLPEKISTTDVSSVVDPGSAYDHILGYLHKRYQLVVAKSSKRKENILYHSIIELDRSGMNFKPHQEDNWSMTIKFQSSPWFWSKTILLMPTLIIDDFTEVILRNFIAYEQSFPQGRYYFTSYVHAMDMLIDTQEDVAILAESKVLFNRLCSNQEAADMINKICKNMFVTDFYYAKEFEQMDKHYNRFWPKHIAWLRRIYFSNPWSIIALLAAIIVSLATVVATIFAVLEYFR